MLYRIPKKGTFLSSPLIEYDLLGFYNFKEEVEKQGKKLTINFVSFQIKKELNIKFSKIYPEENLVIIERVLLVNKLPILLERTTIPYFYVEGITEEEVKYKPFKEIFENYNIIIKNGKKFIEPQISNHLISKYINVEVGTPILMIDRYVYDLKDNLIAQSEWYVRGDKCRYYINQ